jgi:sigma-B regulation protein RsbU (phosphoserine phosphatase)
MGQGCDESRDESRTPAPAFEPIQRRIPVETLHRLADGFAGSASTALAIISPGGELIAPPAGSHPLATLILEKGVRSLFCVQDDYRPLFPSWYHVAPVVHADCLIARVIAFLPLDALREADAADRFAAHYGVEVGRVADALRSDHHIGAAEGCIRAGDALAELLGTMFGQARRMAHMMDDLQTVHRLAEQLAGPHDIQNILDQTVRRIVDVLAVKAAAIRLLNEQTGELEIKAVCNLSERYLRKGPVRLGGNKIDTAAFAGKSVYIADVPNDPRVRYKADARQEGLASGLCVPLAHGGRAIGVIRVYTAEHHVFDESEEALLRSIGAQAAGAIINARLYESRTEAERVRSQILRAGQIQRRMLPAGPPVHPRIEIGSAYRPTLEMSGDFYDLVELPKGNLGLCIADVVGKGLPAAMLMASIRASLRAHAHSIYDLAEIMAQVNRQMCRDTLPSEFASVIYGVISPDGGRLTYTNAGHPPALLLRSGALDPLHVGGMVIGVDPSQRFEQSLLDLQSGDVITMYTDGVTEALNFEGQAYGASRLRDSIRRHADLPAPQLAEQLLWDVRRFAGLADQSDDITIVVVKVH